LKYYILSKIAQNSKQTKILYISIFILNILFIGGVNLTANVESNEGEKEADLTKEFLELFGECLELIGSIILNAANVHTFKAIYPGLVKTLKSVEDTVEKITEDAKSLGVPEAAKWLRNAFNFSKYYVDGMKDWQSWNFETESMAKAKIFLNAFVSEVPKMFEDGWKGVEQMFKTALKGQDGIEISQRGIANMGLGKYMEAAANYEKLIAFYNKTNDKTLMVAIGPAEASLWYAKAMGYQYELGDFLQASKAFEESSKLFNREANKAALAEDVFTEGTFRAMKVMCDKRASMCLTLYNRVGKRPEYVKVREEINDVQTSFWEAPKQN
jgi:tetratricopeptide (TPR) repeat protein